MGRIGAEQRVAGGHRGRQQGAADQGAAKAQKAQQHAREGAHEHRAQGRGEAQISRLDRAQPEADLKQQRQHERRRVEPHATEAPGHRADVEGLDAQRVEIEDRRGAVPGVVPIGEQHDQGQREKREAERWREHRTPDILDRQFQQEQSHPGDHKADEVEARRRRGAEILE